MLSQREGTRIEAYEYKQIMGIALGEMSCLFCTCILQYINIYHGEVGCTSIVRLLSALKNIGKEEAYEICSNQLSSVMSVQGKERNSL